MVYGYMVFNVVHLNGILGQHGAVQLHWRKGQLLKRGILLDVFRCVLNLGDVAILDLGCVTQLLPLDPFRGKA